MRESRIEWYNIITIFLFVVFTIYWIITQLLPQYNTHHQIYSFSTIYGIVALVGGSFGLFISKKWGGLHTFLGKSIIFFSLGLLAQEFGQLTYSYNYIILHLATADYPSLGDIGFFGSIPLYCLGVLYLAKVSGATLRIKSIKHTLPAVLIALAILASGYILFLVGYEFDWSKPVKVFLDFGYPLGEAIYISLAISAYLLSRGVLGGVMRRNIFFILFALLIQFIADYTFLYQTNKGNWIDGGINDFTYLISYFLMTIALLRLNIAFKQLKHEDSK